MHSIRATLLSNGWSMNGTDGTGRLDPSHMSPDLFFDEGDVVAFSAHLPRGMDFSLAAWSGKVEEGFSPLTSSNDTVSRFGFRTGPTMHYFCEACVDLRFDDIHVRPRPDPPTPPSPSPHPLPEWRGRKKRAQRRRGVP